MLPAKSDLNRTYRPDDTPEVRPGSWWRLKDETHELAGYPAPGHGLVLMVSEARAVDGELHSVVLHPHPLWSHAGRRGDIKLLAGDFLQAFAPEPEGERLREAEISAVMGRVSGITAEIATPPDPMLLLEKQTEQRDPAPEETGESGGIAQDETLPGNTLVPTALLPSADVVSAQKAIETRIAAFEAQKTWITERTNALNSEMKLVSIYQTEKVNTSLAGISQETRRAEDLLKSVQTMRLFLGEDMAVTTLLKGESADPCEPLTFMQRMLFLDEEIFIHDLLEGFDGDMMGELPDLMARDFSLVERMLPHPRCVAIARVRRNSRALHMEEKMTVADFFAHLEIAKADQRIHILVRDGTNLHMITADEATSNAERLFPSRAEIDGLFKKGHFGDGRQITPDDVDYTDARARHDTRALFYKRFLLILWGVHERSDIFGPFAPKGMNWLDQSVHSERFRFIHDEENVLGDGRPSIDDFIAAHNTRARAGSRVMINWEAAANEETAPGACYSENYQTRMRGHFTQGFDLATVFAENGSLKVKGPFAKETRYSYDPDPKPVMTRVAVKMPVAGLTGQPHRLYDMSDSQGFICIDELSLADMDYYIASRRARESYGRWLHLFNRARAVVKEEEARRDALLAQLMPSADTAEAEMFRKALHLWRSGNKWGWPETDRQQAALRKIMDRLSATLGIQALAGNHGRVLQSGIKANGDIFVVHDGDVPELPDGTPLPWLTEVSYASLKSKKVKSTRRISWFDLDGLGQIVLHEDKELREEVLERLAPSGEITTGHFRDKKTSLVHNWRVPRGFADARAEKVLQDIAGNGDTIEALKAALEANNKQVVCHDWLHETFANHKTERDRQVVLPQLHLHAGVLYGLDSNGMPRSWLLGYAIQARALAWKLGYKDEVRNQVESLYKHPGQIYERLDESAGGLSVMVREVGLKRTLASRFSKGVCLSFDSDYGTLNTWCLPKGESLAWREIAAQLVAKSNAGWHSNFTLEDLRAGAERLHFIGSPGAEELNDLAFAFACRK